VYVRFRSPSLLSSEAIDGRRRDLQMNEGKVEQTTDTLFAVLLATGSCNWRPRGWENDYIDLRRGHFFTFCDWLHSVSAGSGSCSSRRENEKCRQVSSQRDSQPTTHPTHQTNQPVKKQNLSGPGWEQRIY
jgi:hypothetical protein